jgi:hypothetical protein
VEGSGDGLGVAPAVPPEAPAAEVPLPEPGFVVPASLPGLLEPESVGVAVELSVGESVGDPPDVDESVGEPEDVAVGDVLLGDALLSDPDVDTEGVAVAVGDCTGGTVARQLGAGVAE